MCFRCPDNVLSVLRTHLVGPQWSCPALLPGPLLTACKTGSERCSPLQDFRSRLHCLRAAEPHRQIAHSQPGVQPQQTLQGLHGALVRGPVQTGQFNKRALLKIKRKHENERGAQCQHRIRRPERNRAPL